MSLASTLRKDTFPLSDPFPTDFAIDFKYWKKSDIVVKLSFAAAADQTLILDTDYTLTAPSNNGTLSRLSDWTGATKMTAYRQREALQQSQYRLGQAIPPKTLETDLDYCVALIQELQEALSRVPVAAITDPVRSFAMPSIGESAGRFWAWDMDGSIMAAAGVTGVPVTPYIASLMDDINALAAQKTLGMLAAGAASPIASELQSVLGAADAASAMVLLSGQRLTAGNWAKIFKSLLVPFVPYPLHKSLMVAIGGTPRYANNRTNTSTTTKKLVDSGATFITWGTQVGDTIYNATDGKWCRATAVDSQTQLSVDVDVFLATGKTYKLWSTPSLAALGIDNALECDGSTVSDAQSIINGFKLPDLNGNTGAADEPVAGGRFLRGGTTSGVDMDDSLELHFHEIYYGPSPGILQHGGSGASTATTSLNPSGGTQFTIHNPTSDGTHPIRAGAETRPRFTSVVWIMRHK